MHLMFGCNRHHCHLDGKPEIEIVQERGVVKVWGFNLTTMLCAGAENTTDPECVSSWRVTQA